MSRSFRRLFARGEFDVMTVVYIIIAVAIIAFVAVIIIKDIVGSGGTVFSPLDALFGSKP